jgi:alkaline phosphatase
MKSRRLTAALAATAAVAVVGGGTAAATGVFSRADSTERAVRTALDDRHPKNVIFLLGDGMGTQEITAARYYQGVHSDLNVDRMPLTGFDTTWSVKPAANPPYLPDYDPDSASTGTSWATGRKTIDERISQGPSSAIDVPGKNYRTLLERAQRSGKKVGNVSTAEITDATPAVLDSHVNDRGCQGPADMANCPQFAKPAGPGSIAEQTVDHGVDVVLGGGLARFEQKVTGGPYAGKTVLDQAAGEGYTFVGDAAGLAAIKPKSKGKVLGLFNRGNMTLEWSGLPAAHPASGPQVCTEDNRETKAPNEPSLEDMTTKAISILDAKAKRSKSGKGYFLQVEGASIDKQDHAANPCGQIGETVAFDEAVQVARAYAAKHPDTLVVVTADHTHTSQIIEEVDAGTPGLQSILTTKDGTPLFINYATVAPGPNASQQHTGSEVRIAAEGPQAANVVGVIDETDEFTMMARALGLK